MAVCSACLFLPVPLCLSHAGYPLLSDLPSLSSHSRPVLTTLSWQPFPGGLSLPVLFHLLSHTCLCACPVLSVTFWVSRLEVLFWLCVFLIIFSFPSCPGFLVLAGLSWQPCPSSPVFRAVLSWQCCPGSLVLSALFRLFRFAYPFCLSCSACPIMNVPFCLSCSACPFLLLPFCLFCSACPVLAVLFCLSCSDCPVLTVLFCLTRSGCPVQPDLFCVFRCAFPVLPVLFCLSCSACSILPFLFCLTCFACLVLPVLLCLSVLPIIWYTYKFCPVLPVPFYLSRSACPVLTDGRVSF
jgi:hypothetical protein